MTDALRMRGGAAPSSPGRNGMKPNVIDWIWHVRGSLEIAPGQSDEEVFDRLDPLFRETGTRHERSGDTLTFQKKDQAAQDKMSIFDSGVLRIERAAAGATLRYHLTSRALLFCFLAPLLFLAIAQLTVVVNRFHAPSSDASEEAPKADDKAKPVAMNPIDKFLGAPAPEKPKKGGDKPEGRNKKPSTTAAYVFAAMFAVLYVIGRLLEDWLIKATFRKRLRGS
jgi:hypothetical protein